MPQDLATVSQTDTKNKSEPKGTGTKDNLDFIKILSFCVSPNPIKRVKGPSARLEGRKIKYLQITYLRTV